eukprot:gene10834-10914_t
MFAFILSRVFQAVPVLLIVGFISFAMFAFVGDPVTVMLGQDYTEAQRVALVKQLGLDQPLFVQYGNFVWQALHGNFGISYRLARPVGGLIAERLPATLELALTAAVLAVAIGIPMGVFTGIRRNSVLSRLFMLFSLVGVSLPTFLIGILLILVFAVVLGWLPSFGRGDVVQLGHWSTGFLTASGRGTLLYRLLDSDFIYSFRQSKIAMASALVVFIILIGAVFAHQLAPHNPFDLLTFPAILIALLVDGVVRAVVPQNMQERLQLYVIVFAIGISLWPQFARTVRGSTMIERGRDYVMAARIIGLSGPRIVLTHILPNVLGPIFVIATLNLGIAIIAEATLSFLGVGLPPTEPGGSPSSPA